jgi:protein-disulfide isomerase
MLRSSFFALLAGAVIALPILANPAQALSDADKDAVRATIREYILENPEIVREAIEALEKKQADAANQAASKAIAEKKDQIFNSKHQIVLGKADGDVTLVEFFDYNCGYCRKALDDVNALLKSDSDVRVVLKEFPILSRGSMEAAQVGIAVNRQAPEKYLEFHNKLFAAREETGKPADKTQALAVAKAVGLDVDRLEKDLDSPEVRAAIEESYELAQALNINGTPAFIIGEDVSPGAIGIEQLKQKVQSMRSCGKASC